MRQLVRGRRLRRLVGVTAAAACALTMAIGGASGAPTDDPRAERDRVRRQAAEVAAQVDALQGSQAEVSAALATLAANVAAEEARLADAQRAAEQAAAAAAVARAAAEAAAAELAAMEEQVRGLAVQAYMTTGVDDEAAETFLESDDLTDAMQRRELLRHRHGSHSDSVDRLRAAREDRDIARAEADAASERAIEHEAAVEAHLASVQAARDQQQAILNAVEARLDASLSEAAGLAALDAQLSQQIARQEAELAARARAAQLRPRREPPPVRAAAVAAAAVVAVAMAVARQQAAAVAVGRWGGGGGGGGAPPPASNPFPVGNVSLTTVRGITVNVQIALVARVDAGRRVGPGSQLLRRRLPQPGGAVGAAPGALSRSGELAAVGLLATDGPARQLDARARAGDRLHLQGPDHLVAQQSRLPVAGRPRRRLRLLQPPQRAVALERQRQLTATPRAPGWNLEPGAVRAAYRACALALVDVATRIPRTAWDQPGLGVWSVRDLVGHASRALSVAEAYLDATGEGSDAVPSLRLLPGHSSQHPRRSRGRCRAGPARPGASWATIRSRR